MYNTLPFDFLEGGSASSAIPESSSFKPPRGTHCSTVRRFTMDSGGVGRDKDEWVDPSSESTSASGTDRLFPLDGRVDGFEAKCEVVRQFLVFEFLVHLRGSESLDTFRFGCFLQTATCYGFLISHYKQIKYWFNSAITLGYWIINTYSEQKSSWCYTEPNLLWTSPPFSLFLGEISVAKNTTIYYRLVR